MTIPSTFGGRFSVLSEHVRRPSSVLFLASDRVLGGREVILKVFVERPEGKGKWIAAFDKQVSALRSASHPVLVPIIAGGYEEGWFFLALEYLAEGSLREVLKRDGGPLPLTEATYIHRELCAGLAELQAVGTYHGHLDSRAILFKKGEPRIAGYYPPVIAQMQRGNSTGSGLLVEPAYVAPEQVQGHSIDARADMYSLSLLLYEMTTGVRAFSSESPLQTAFMRLTEKPQAPNQLNPSIPGHLSDAILRGLSVSPEDRFSSFQEFADACELDRDAKRNPLRNEQQDSQTRLRSAGSVETIPVSMSTEHLREMLQTPLQEPSNRVEKTAVSVSLPRKRSMGIREACSYVGAAVAGAILILLLQRHWSSPTSITEPSQEVSTELAEAELELRLKARQRELETSTRQNIVSKQLVRATMLHSAGSTVLPLGASAYDELQLALRVSPNDVQVIDLLYSWAAESVREGDRAREQSRFREARRSYLVAQALGVSPKFLSSRFVSSTNDRDSVEPAQETTPDLDGYLDRARIEQAIAKFTEKEF